MNEDTLVLRFFGAAFVLLLILGLIGLVSDQAVNWQSMYINKDIREVELKNDREISIAKMNTNRDISMERMKTDRDINKDRIQADKEIATLQIDSQVKMHKERLDFITKLDAASRVNYLLSE